MYCVKCGVELGKGEEKCPLCQTPVMHPDYQPDPVARPYPFGERIPEALSRHGVLLATTFGFLFAALLCLFIDIQIEGNVSWSGFACGGLLSSYAMVIFPLWFRRPNPVLTIPVFFATLIPYLLYIDLKTGGEWFLSFAFPASGAIFLLSEGSAAVWRYVPKGRLYVFGADLMLLGGLCIFLEFLLSITFSFPGVFGWSLAPFCALEVLGLWFLACAIIRPLRRALYKRFFI